MTVATEPFNTSIKSLSSIAQVCLQANSNGGNSLPDFIDPGTDAPRIDITPIQAIIKSYEFQCCGMVKEWAAFVEPGGSFHRGVYTIKFQIWRPTDCNRYDKAGENTFSFVNLSPSSVINEIPPSNEQLQFQPGDVLGYYLERADNNNNGGLQFDDSFTQEELWYATGSSDLQNENRLDVGTGGDLSISTNLGPIISVSFSEYAVGLLYNWATVYTCMHHKHI